MKSIKSQNYKFLFNSWKSFLCSKKKVFFLFPNSFTSRFSGFAATTTRKHKEKVFYRSEERKTWLHASGCDCDFMAQVHRQHPEKWNECWELLFLIQLSGFVVWEFALGFEEKWKEVKNRDNISQATLEGFVFVEFQSWYGVWGRFVNKESTLRCHGEQWWTLIPRKVIFVICTTRHITLAFDVLLLLGCA